MVVLLEVELLDNNNPKDNVWSWMDKIKGWWDQGHQTWKWNIPLGLRSKDAMSHFINHLKIKISHKEVQRKRLPPNLSTETRLVQIGMLHEHRHL
jgi:hypothetical protein